MPKKKSKVTYIPKMDLQFFGRIRKMELACPDCGAMHELREGSQYWNSHTSRFRCRECFSQYDLGIVAWYPNYGRMELPDDTITPLRRPANPGPGYTASLHTRLANYFRRHGIMEPVNVLVPDPQARVVEVGTIAELREARKREDEGEEEAKG